MFAPDNSPGPDKNQGATPPQQNPPSGITFDALQKLSFGNFGRRTPQVETLVDGMLMGAGGMLYPPGTPLTALAPLLPSNGASAVDRIVYVNGIMTHTERHYRYMQALADTGAEVIGVRNATRGRLRDLRECVSDKFNKGTSLPAQTVAELVRESVQSKQPLHLLGHSQGAIIVGRALRVVRDELLVQGMSPHAAEAALAHLRVETYGGGEAHYVDGPQYVHVQNEYDPVVFFFGNGKASQKLSRRAQLGKDAVVFNFKEFNAPFHAMQNAPYHERLRVFFDQSVHGPESIYFRRRVPFDQARQGMF